MAAIPKSPLALIVAPASTTTPAPSAIEPRPCHIRAGWGRAYRRSTRTYLPFCTLDNGGHFGHYALPMASEPSARYGA
jgi:hypothetical protein